MPKGLPDSWAAWGAKKIIQKTKKRSRGASTSGTAVTRTILQTTRTTISYKFGNVKIYEGVLKSYLNTSSGDLWKWLAVKGDLAVAGAKAQVGVRTGALRNSIYKRHLGNFTGQYLRIGSNKSYAYIHHEGTRPHIITTAGGNNKPMVFRKGAVLVHTKKVFHPGTKPNPYLRNQLKHFDKRYQ